MRKIKTNSKIFSVIFGIVDVLLVLATLFLLIVSMIFAGNTAPSIFSNNVYLVKTEAFSLIKNGSALITEKSPAEEIAPGNILVIDSDGSPYIAEVQSVNSVDEIFTYSVKLENNELHTVGYSDVVGKGLYYSEFLGALISFALSQAGVLLIAVLPCLALIIAELIRFFSKKKQSSEVVTVKKQDESPIYVPSGNRLQLPPENDEPDDKPVFAAGKPLTANDAGLFVPPRKGERQESPKKAPLPVSARDIDKLIMQTKQEHIQQMLKPRADAPAPKAEAHKTAPIPGVQPRHASKQAINSYTKTMSPVDSSTPAAESEREKPVEITAVKKDRDVAIPSIKLAEEDNTVKRYVPKKSGKIHSRADSLDSLLREEPPDTRFDIDDILRTIEEKDK